jgi:hypothetical protein
MSTVHALQGEAIRGLPFEKYLDMTEESATSLKDMAVSPLLYFRRREMERPDTDTLRTGRAGHTAILEPDRFMLEYALWPEDNGARRGKKWDAFKEMHQGQTILVEKQYRTALKMRDAARRHPVARKYLEERGQAEVSIKWTHPRTGIKCKSRLDWLCSTLTDLKSTRNPSPGKFATDAAKFGYDLQLAFYSDALATVGVVLPVKIIAVQNVEPFDVVVFNVPEEVLTTGRFKYEEALDKVIACRKSGEWPGLAHNEEVELRLPDWAVAETEEELTLNGESLF